MSTLFLAQVEQQPVQLVGEEPADILDLSADSIYQATEPLSYDLTARKISGGILVSGTVATRIEGECGRCLERVSQKVVNDDVCLFYENLTVPELNITDDVRNEMVIELPINLLCSEDCRGLCPRCGANLNLETCTCARQEPDAEAASDEASPWKDLDGLKLS